MGTPFTILILVLFVSFISESTLTKTLQQEKEQIRNIKMDRIYKYCNESPICNKLDKEFIKFNSKLNEGRFE